MSCFFPHESYHFIFHANKGQNLFFQWLEYNIPSHKIRHTRISNELWRPLGRQQCSLFFLVFFLPYLQYALTSHSLLQGRCHRHASQAIARQSSCSNLSGIVGELRRGVCACHSTAPTPNVGGDEASKQTADTVLPLVLCRPGGPFDLMSRRLIAASSTAVAERLASHIVDFPVGRDDAHGSGKN